MESARENLCSVIQYYKGPNAEHRKTGVIQSIRFETQNSVKGNVIQTLSKNSEESRILYSEQKANYEKPKVEFIEESKISSIKGEGIIRKVEKSEFIESKTESVVKIKKEYHAIKSISEELENQKTEVKWLKTEPVFSPSYKQDTKNLKAEVLPEPVKRENNFSVIKIKKTEFETKDENLEPMENESDMSIKTKKRTLSDANADSESVTPSVISAEEEAEANDDGLESDSEDTEEDIGNKPRKRGRCKKNPDIIPSHLSSDMVLGYKILLKFLETPQFSGFHKPFKKASEAEENCKITSLNQIKKKFEENLYKKISDFVNDVREMLISIYESRNQVSIKKALRLEQILEQRIAQLPNYLRPQCALVLSSDEVNNCHNKIRITKGGGFVSLLLEKTEKKRYEKNREKRKLLAEERKQLKEEQDKDVQEWEKNVLLKDFEEDIKSMWELPAIGHFIHLCADIFNIGEIAQFEVERMLLMPQCSDTLDLIMTALLTNSLMRAKLDRTPSMPYSIWGPLVRTRVMSWYRMWHRDGKNEQKIFEEVGIEPEFWKILGPDINPLDYYYFHEISLLQRVWILKTLCDVDFVRKKTVYDNIRAQTLDELSPVQLGLDQHGNRYIQFKQFCGSDIRIYRQSMNLEGNITSAELLGSIEEFENREGPITAEKVFKDIWELNDKPKFKPKRKKKMMKTKMRSNFSAKLSLEAIERKNLRLSAREKQKTYADWSESDQSDTDLRTLKNKLLKPESETLYRPFSNKEFISLSVFRLSREKVNKTASKRGSYAGRKTEDVCRNDSDKIIKTESDYRKEDIKPSECEDEQSDSLDAKHMHFGKNFHGDDLNEDEFDLREKIDNCELSSSDVKFTVKNLENLKMVFKKGSSLREEDPEKNISGIQESSRKTTSTEENTSIREKDYGALYKYNVPNYLKPDSNKFYLVVDSVEGLRQLISKFGSHENDLEIITRSTKSKKKHSCQTNTSSEVQLIERLQNLLLELEPWELDLMKSSRLNKEKMYKEYMNFLNRPPDFVHPNEAYWMKTYEEPNSTTSSTTITTTTVPTEGNGEKSNKESCSITGESTDVNLQDTPLDALGLRKRNRVTRVQLQPESDDLDEDFDRDDDDEDYESNGSDDNWVLPTPKKRPKKETLYKTPKLPKRSVLKKAKSSTFEKSDWQINSGEKSQGSSPEKVKKALFWGPRSTDPSEDLNWETNRQKILEQHNSPIKKLKPDETTKDLEERVIENPRQSTQNTQSVIIASPKRLTTQIPGNKKPYLSSAHLKAMENQEKKGEVEETQHKFFSAKSNTSKPEVRNTASNTSPDFSVKDDADKAPATKIQTYSRIKKARSTQPGIVNSETSDKNVQPPTEQVDSEATTVEPQTVQSEPEKCTVSSDKEAQEESTDEKPETDESDDPPQTQGQELGQSRVITSVTNTKTKQPVQLSQKVIVSQPLNQSEEIIQQVQIETQVISQNTSEEEISDHSEVQIQSQIQQVIESQELPAVSQPVQVSSEQQDNFLQMVPSQNQIETLNPDDLYITDGKNLMKLDNSFVHQLQKDKMLTLDLKKTLLLVKPKTEPNQPQIPNPNQQNILVISKPGPVEQTVSTASVPNFVIPTNYIIKEDNQQAQVEEQTIKIVQQSPTYVIQQKPILNKSIQPQVIKIITSQPMATNQNLILAPVANQVIQPLNQTTVTSEQQAKQSLRLVRPQIATSVASQQAQSKINSVPGSIIVNNIVQIQGQGLEAPKPQPSLVTGRIVSTAVPSVRMATPQTVIPSIQPLTPTKSATNSQPQPQTILTANLTPQGVRSNVITQPVRLTTITQGQVQTLITSTDSSPRFVVSTTPAVKMTTTSQPQFQTSPSLNQTQPVRFSTSPHQITIPSVSSPQIIKPSGLNTQQVRPIGSQPQTVIQSSAVSPQIVRPTAALNTQTIRLVSQPQLVPTQTLMASTTPHIPGSSANLNTQSVKIVQPQQFQTQTVIPCVNFNSQTVRLATNMTSQPIRFVQSQPVRLIANNSVGVKFINKNAAAPVKTTMITGGAQSSVVGVSNVRPSGVVCQPIRYQTIVQPSTIRPVQNKIQLAFAKKTAGPNTLINAPILIVEDEEDEIRILGEKMLEPPVTLDYINGELSVKKTSQGWKYAVKASNGKDIILTDEQIEARLKANNGVMK